MLVQQLASGVVVLLGAWLTLVFLSGLDGMTMPMWTGSALALCVFWLGGLRLWPGVAVGLFLSTVLTGRAMLAPSVTLGTVLEAVVGVHLLRAAGFRVSLGRMRDALALMALLTTVGPLLTACVTFLVIMLFAGPLAAPDAPSFIPPGMTALSYSLMSARFTWIGDAVGAVLLAPTVLVWAGLLGRGVRISRARLAEAAALAIFLSASALVGFGVVDPGPVQAEYVIFPALFWAALRFGPGGATLSALVTQTVLIWLTLHNLGPFASHTDLIDPGRIQTFAIISAASVLLLATTSTERQRASEEAGRLRAESRFGMLIEHISDVVLVLDRHGRLTYSNSAANRMLGYSDAELRALQAPSAVPSDEPGAMGVFSLLHPRDRAELWSTLARGPAPDQDVAARELQVRHADGSWRTMEVTTRNLLAHPSVNGIILTARDITQRKQAEDALQRLALYDPLTGLPNRALLQDRLEQALESAPRQQSGFAMVMCDLDRFKEVNDTLGHQAGDALLCEVAQRLQQYVRRSDTIARLGGDEFALILPNITDREVALEVVRGFVAALEEPFVIEGTTIGIAGSAGIALFPDHGDDATSLLRSADIAMYAAKRAHLGALIYSPEHNTTDSGELALFSELRTAITTGELTLHYQPKVALSSGAADAVEALVRWQHRDRGLLQPEEFLPLAERSGLMPALTRWVVEAAVRQLRIWHEQGLPLVVAVNLSPSALADLELPNDIVRLVHTYGVSPADVVVEVTETGIMADHTRALVALTHLREAGIRISVDDFGTGQSSLAYLKTLPLDELKIDRGFVQDMLTNTRDAAIVRSIVELGHRLGLKVTAEGVEDPGALQALSELGCDLAQGFWMGHPLPEEHLRAWFAAHRARADQQWVPAASGSARQRGSVADDGPGHHGVTERAA